MTGWLIALAVLVGLAILPLGLVVRYDAEGFRLRARVGFVGFNLYPAKEKKSKKEKKASKKKKGFPAIAEKHKGGSFRLFLSLAKLAVEFLGDFRRKLRVKRMDLMVGMAGENPADLAMNYGKAWMAVGNLVPLLEHAFVIKKRNIDVDCDFSAEETTVLARLDMTITFGRLLCLGVRYGLRGVQLFTTIKNTKKGGASK